MVILKCAEPLEICNPRKLNHCWKDLDLTCHLDWLCFKPIWPIKIPSWKRVREPIMLSTLLPLFLNQKKKHTVEERRNFNIIRSLSYLLWPVLRLSLMVASLTMSRDLLWLPLWPPSWAMQIQASLLLTKKPGLRRIAVILIPKASFSLRNWSGILSRWILNWRLSLSTRRLLSDQ